MKNQSKGINGFFDVDNPKFFKGEPSKKIRVYFYYPNSRKEYKGRCNPNYLYLPKEMIGAELLFYTVEREGKDFTYAEVQGPFTFEKEGGKSIFDEEVAKVKELVEKLK